MTMEFNARCPNCGVLIWAHPVELPDAPEAVDAPPLTADRPVPAEGPPEGADYHRESALQLLAMLDTQCETLTPHQLNNIAQRALIRALLAISYMP